MAKKIFRLHENGPTEKTGWFKSGTITSKHLETIKIDGKDVATSIPTPFATIDLVKSAFKWVAENGIKGNTAQHKLVSDAFDVAQLFYSSPKFAEKVRIVTWSPKKRLEDLIENGTKNHKKYAKTLSLFWDQDSVDDIGEDKVLYNFESTKELFFILNRENNNIIGSTSPATLFIASPDLRKVTENLEIKIGQDKLFDEKYASLAERESSFIKYIYALSKQHDFSLFFPEVYRYLNKATDSIEIKLRKEIANLNSDSLNKYPKCTVFENKNEICEILGIELGVQETDSSKILLESDFVIESDFKPDENVKPLVLPRQTFSKKWTYTTEGIIWEKNTVVPDKNKFNPKESKLPEQHDNYYWLTIGNFLEDKIIKLPYPIDGKKFICCNSEKCLLPLSATFFKYFKAKRASELLTIKEQSGGNIEVELEIPVKKGKILFTKKYTELDKNICNLDIHLAVFPFFKSKNLKTTYIGLLDDRGNAEFSDDLNISCIKNGEKLKVGSPITRNPGEGNELISKYYKLEKQPDVLGVLSSLTSGFVIPILSEASGTTKINFAIDFGTTNTHIEYKYEGREPVSLDNTTSLPLWQSLIDRNKNKEPQYTNNEITFEQEILPRLFHSDNKSLRFPLRTALVYNKNVDFTKKVDIVREANSYLLLEKINVPNYLAEEKQLKWSNFANNTEYERKIETYIEFLTTIVFYKALQLGGSHTKTTIIWFYPVSMGSYEREILSKLWSSVYKRVFNLESSDTIAIKEIPESIAPYLFYKSSAEGLSLSIDIGGGTSDIAVFDENDEKAQLISSFKFAGNTIFGDGYYSGDQNQGNSDNNGFVKTFKDEAQETVKDDEQKSQILEKILNDKNSADFSSYLFFLEQEDESSFSYTRLLQKNKKLKLSILVFYAAIAYYSAKLLKKSGVGIPKNILFSGGASKSASIIDPSKKNLKILAAMFKFFFESIYKEKAKVEVKIILSDIPKEVTCKGALKANIDNIGNIDESPIKFWIGGTNGNLEGVYDRENVRNTLKYGDLDDSKKEEIENSIKDFYSILDEYKGTINIESKYGIGLEAYLIFENMRNNGLKDFLGRGINTYHKKDDARIEETLFFYPLIGILNKLSYELADEKN